MPRKNTKTRPQHGMRLAELRKDAGLSQYELARYVGVPQANIAFCERSEKPPRSDVLPKMAQVLGVSVEDLLIVGDEKPLKKKAAKSNGRPAGKVREVFDPSQSSPAASRSTSSIGSPLMSPSTSKTDKVSVVYSASKV